LGTSKLENEEILRQADGVFYHMRVGGRESAVLGRLILTNLRITFAEVEPRKKGLLGFSERGKNVRPLINYRIARLIRADVASRPIAMQPATGELATAEAQQMLDIFLNTPKGREDFIFEVTDPQEWALAINDSIMGRAEDLSQKLPDGAKAMTGEYIQGKQQKAKDAGGRKKYCPECGKELELNTKFCWECGAAQPDGA
jgi:hypothetical protein